MRRSFVLPMAALVVCAVVLMMACGSALSEVFLHLRGSSLFLGL